ncbi:MULTISPECIES: DUF3916 domain-containing protein [Dickeya]|uniref:DUF3916 domain-containing protein n=1 Tax=Dickeya TaxID=204037 RepID=UPI00057718D7|nr:MULTISPECIES: DUF3916 domain-containing protein [Dickeya]UGA53174.1 DUF3916 domain-containing protein [Dickeya fangzhongdai]
MTALNRWAETFHNPNRAVFSEDQHYWNYKIPVNINLVEEKYSNQKIKADCAQSLINACSNLMLATADWEYCPRITAVICLPDMFTSEVCLFRSEDYFQGFISEGSTENSSSELLEKRSLAEEWGLILPNGVQELGIALEYHGGDDPDEWFTGERWYYGQLQ